MKTIKDIPSEHTAAIIKGQDEVVYSGKIKDATKEWDNMVFSGIHGIFQFACFAIDGTWYRTSWMQL